MGLRIWVGDATVSFNRDPHFQRVMLGGPAGRVTGEERASIGTLIFRG